MLTRNKKLKDYGIPAEDIEKLNTMLKDFPAEYGYLLSGAALSACPKKHGDSGYGYREYLTPEKLQKNQQRKIYLDGPERLLRIQAQDRRCTV